MPLTTMFQVKLITGFVKFWEYLMGYGTGQFPCKKQGNMFTAHLFRYLKCCLALSKYALQRLASFLLVSFSSGIEPEKNDLC
ncbi:hypothetical protein LIER_27961 [Lithospermum erythrorhizon]|uniref:Uncharacterized protein n=1 Tax=Lithospermum erythrorhizon TaxID=34254 RepID=A0AAV3RDV3_LITER